jgi:NAD+ synthase (glutamine-hydrolysing)
MPPEACRGGSRPGRFVNRSARAAGCADAVMKTRLALAQINVTVGDFAGNVARIVAAARAAPTMVRI